MECGVCGKHADIVVADGVSVGYSSAKFVQGLRPPSTVDKSSLINSTVFLQGGRTAAITSSDLRKELRLSVETKVLSPMSALSLGLQYIPGLLDVFHVFLRTPSQRLRSALRELFIQVGTHVEYSIVALKIM
jgi:hypothetical protein